MYGLVGLCSWPQPAAAQAVLDRSMFSHLLSLRERQHAERQPHRLAAAGSAPCTAAGASGAASPRGLHAPSRMGAGASMTSPRGQKLVHGNERHHAGALPVFRSLNGRRARLPSVRPAVEHPAAMYSSLEGLQRMGESVLFGASKVVDRRPSCLPADDAPSQPPTAPDSVVAASTRRALPSLPAAGELFKGKHSTVCNYLDIRTGAVVAVKA